MKLIRIESEIHLALKKQALENGVTLQSLINEILRNVVNSDK
jgi:predicted HicB family RNase H-like nuclease